MRLSLTVLTHRRPEYLRETLEALARCDGIEDWRVVLVMDRPNAETRDLCWLTGWENVNLNMRNASDPPYARVSRATLMALSLGFATSDYVVHLEEDCVPAPEFLRWHKERAERYRDDKVVFTVNAWSGPPNATHGADHLARHFTPWGWGTWQDRFAEMRAGWDMQHWDRHLNEVLRGDRRGVFPSTSLVRNIGEHGGVTGAPHFDARALQAVGA